MPLQLSKYAISSETFAFDFSTLPVILDGDSLASIVSITVEPTSLTLGPSQIVNDTVEIVLSGGKPGLSYTLDVVIQTTSEAIIQGSGILNVS